MTPEVTRAEVPVLAENVPLGATARSPLVRSKTRLITVALAVLNKMVAFMP
jgi:hypothetical protein